MMSSPSAVAVVGALVVCACAVLAVKRRTPPVRRQDERSADLVIIVPLCNVMFLRFWIFANPRSVMVHGGSHYRYGVLLYCNGSWWHCPPLNGDVHIGRQHLLSDLHPHAGERFCAI
ncbi:hypothetical protein [Sphingomonas sp. HMP6]|uniref:hypothetical protein n=1 Tax=Sphingomonas sp. HMP6 TaxID=1517551 RepID=UPI001E496916|nr:hypothetical protein [Sphingomonas sp. HMP6]